MPGCAWRSAPAPFSITPISISTPFAPTVSALISLRLVVPLWLAGWYAGTSAARTQKDFAISSPPEDGTITSRRRRHDAPEHPAAKPAAREDVPAHALGLRRARRAPGPVARLRGGLRRRLRHRRLDRAE